MSLWYLQNKAECQGKSGGIVCSQETPKSFLLLIDSLVPHAYSQVERQTPTTQEKEPRKMKMLKSSYGLDNIH